MTSLSFRLLDPGRPARLGTAVAGFLVLAAPLYGQRPVVDGFSVVGPAGTTQGIDRFGRAVAAGTPRLSGVSRVFARLDGTLVGFGAPGADRLVFESGPDFQLPGTAVDLATVPSAVGGPDEIVVAHAGALDGVTYVRANRTVALPQPPVALAQVPGAGAGGAPEAYVVTWDGTRGILAALDGGAVVSTALLDGGLGAPRDLEFDPLRRTLLVVADGGGERVFEVSPATGAVLSTLTTAPAEAVELVGGLAGDVWVRGRNASVVLESSTRTIGSVVDRVLDDLGIDARGRPWGLRSGLVFALDRRTGDAAAVLELPRGVRGLADTTLAARVTGLAGDLDGDGFGNAVETSVATDPFDPQSRPDRDLSTDRAAQALGGTVGLTVLGSSGPRGPGRCSSGRRRGVRWASAASTASCASILRA